MNRFDPLITYSSPSRRASLRIAAESEPERGWVSAYAHSHSPPARRGRYCSFCASVPASLRPSEPSSCTARMRPLVAQTFETSSIATSVSSALAPRPPYSSSNMIPNRSCSRKSSTTSHGNSALLSISAARGAIRSRERSRTRSRISRCSSVSGSYTPRSLRRAVKILGRPRLVGDAAGEEEHAAEHREARDAHPYPAHIAVEDHAEDPEREREGEADQEADRDGVAREPDPAGAPRQLEVLGADPRRRVERVRVQRDRRAV